MGCQKLPEDKWLGARQLLLQVRSPVPLYLSPRMQGTLTVIFTEWVRLRLIPVHTGNTHRRRRQYGAPAAHPRAYGEYFQKSQHFELLLGSSPCIRGILVGQGA